MPGWRSLKATRRAASKARSPTRTASRYRAETRKNDNFQSGSSYRVQATRSVIQGQNIYPVFLGDNTTYVEYLPLVAPSVGNDIRTQSFFANDTWRLNDTVSVSLGLRYDRNRSKDQAGTPVVKDAAWSPRPGVTWDIAGNGKWMANRLPAPSGVGRFDLGLIERWDSSDASSADGTIDPRNDVTNPGYQSVPSTVTYYFGDRGDQRYDDLWRTDVSLSWTLRPAGWTRSSAACCPTRSTRLRKSPAMKRLSPVSTTRGTRGSNTIAGDAGRTALNSPAP